MRNCEAKGTMILSFDTADYGPDATQETISAYCDFLQEHMPNAVVTVEYDNGGWFNEDEEEDENEDVKFFLEEAWIEFCTKH